MKIKGGCVSKWISLTDLGDGLIKMLIVTPPPPPLPRELSAALQGTTVMNPVRVQGFGERQWLH